MRSSVQDREICRCRTGFDIRCLCQPQMTSWKQCNMKLIYTTFVMMNNQYWNLCNILYEFAESEKNITRDQFKELFCEHNEKLIFEMKKQFKLTDKNVDQIIFDNFYDEYLEYTDQ